MARASGRVRTVSVRVTAQISDFERNMQRVTARMRRTSRKLTDIGKKMSLAITTPVAIGFVKMIKSASDLQENMNKTNEAFKDSAKNVQDWSKTTLRAFGIAQSSALDMAANFGDMSTSLGLNPRLAADMSKNLVGLAGDLASFKNIRLDVAQTALAGIFTAETESLKKLGIVMTQAALKDFAAQKGMEANLLTMTEAQKVMLRYAFIMDKTKNSQGDFVRTGGDAANQMRIFTESMKQLSANFGKILLPIFNRAIKIVNSLVTRFEKLSDTQKTVILMISGLAATIGPVLVGMGLFLKLITLLSVKLLVIPIAIGAAVTALVALYKKSAEFRNTVNRIMQDIEALYGYFVIGFTEIYNAVGPLIEKITNYMAVTFFAGLEFVESLFGAFLGSVEGNIENGSQGWLDVWEKWSNLSNLVFFGFFTGVINAFEGFWTYIFKKTDDGINWLTKQFNKIPYVEMGETNISKNFKTGMDKIKEGFEWMKETAGVDQIAKDLKDKFKFDSKLDFNFKENVFEKIKNTLDGLSLRELVALGDAGVDAYQNMTSAANEYIKALKNQTHAFANFVGIFDRAERQTFSPGRILSRMRGQVRIMEQWQNNLQKLEQRGLSQQLMNELRGMGAGSGAQIQALTRMSDERLAEFQNLYGQRMSIAGQEAQAQIAGQNAIDTLIESQINITITDSNIRNDEDAEKTAQKIIQKLKLAGVRI